MAIEQKESERVLIRTSQSSLIDFENEEVPENVRVADVYQFVGSCYESVKDGKLLSPKCTRIFYKLRHNALKTLVCNECLVDNLRERKFEWRGIFSNKTPDWWQEIDEKLIIMEITFTNRWDSAVENKMFLTKYQDLVELAKKQLPTFLHYIVFSLDTRGFDLSDQIAHFYKSVRGKEYSPSPAVENFVSEMLDLHFMMMDTIPQLLHNWEDDVKLAIEDLELSDFYVSDVVERSKISVGRDRHLLMRFQLHKKLLMKNLKKSASYKLIKFLYNKNKGTIRLKYVDDGLPVSEARVALEQMNIAIIKKHTIGEDTHKLYDDLFKIDPTEHLMKYGSLGIDVPTSGFEKYSIADYKTYSERWIARYNIEKKNGRIPRCLIDYELNTDYFLYLRDRSSNMVQVLREKGNKYQKSPFIFYPSSPDYGVFDSKILDFEWSDPFSRILFSRIKYKVIKDGISNREKILTRDIDENEYKRSLIIISEFIKGRDKRKDDRVLYLNNIANTMVPKNNINKVLDKFKRRNRIKMLEQSQIPINDEEWSYIEAKRCVSKLTQSRKVFDNRVTINIRRQYKREWNFTMSHFTREESGVDQFPEEWSVEDCERYLHDLYADFFTYTDCPPDDVISDTIPIGDGLASTCEEMRKDFGSKCGCYLNTRLAHYYLFISRYCYSLGYLSLIKSNKDDFLFDNIGYKDCLLIVKGGRKIPTTRNSRLHKLLIPVTSTIADSLPKRQGYEYVKFNNKVYFSTPWRILNINYVKFGYEIYHKSLSYLMTSFLESNMSEEEHRRFTFLKVISSFNQRRKFEIWLGFLRYFYFNSTGTHSALEKLIDDMIVNEQDSIMHSVQTLFINRLPDIYNNSQNSLVYDFLFRGVIENFDYCAERFDESILMVRAPYNPVNEHIINLKNIFDTHKIFLDKVPSLDKTDCLRSTSCKLSENYFLRLGEPFAFDPEMMIHCGAFTADRLMKTADPTEIQSFFNDLMSKHYTEITTSKGMRSDDLSNFWGKKGHDIIFGENYELEIEELKKFLDGEVIDTSHFSYSSMINENPNFPMLFDAKDKEQKKGSREIYVMSKMTKIYQSPLEKMFKKLCSLLPNELIHVPSDNRARMIHSQMFEDPDMGEIRYLILDCKRWAPQSNLWKYYFFIKGMESFLPPNFVKYFNFCWDKMFNKYIILQPKFVELLEKSPGYNNIRDMLIWDDPVYKLPMPYSFMMGIFNYLSSLLHASMQLFFAEEIASRLGATFEMFAHSDDSGGRVIADTDEKVCELIKMYELFQLGGNHMLSVKKSAISAQSFEIISIMYMKRRYIPMTHKFLSGLSIDPSSSGWQADASKGTSIVVECFSNGATMYQCYIMLLTYNEMLRKTYHLPKSKYRSLIPTAVGGLIDLHPIHLIMLGTPAHNCLLELSMDEDLLKRIDIASSALCGDKVPVLGFQSRTVMSYYARHPNASMLNQFDADELNLIKNLSLWYSNHAISSFMTYISNMLDPTFVNSLLNIDNKKLFIYSLYTQNKLETVDGFDLRRLSNDVCGIASEIEYRPMKRAINYKIPPIISEAYIYLQNSETMKVRFQDYTVPTTKTCKPVIYETFSVISYNLERKMTNKVISLLNEPRTADFMKDKLVVDRVYMWVKKRFPDLNDSDLSRMLQKATVEAQKRRIGYIFMPSMVVTGMRQHFWNNCMLYSARRHYSNTAPSFLMPEITALADIPNFSIHRKHKFIWDFVVDNRIEVDIKKEVLKKIEMPREYHDLYNHVLDRDRLFIVDVPFAIYTVPQYKASGVWVGTAEFEIQFQTSKVKQYYRLNTLTTEWYCSDHSNLNIMYQIYQVFCKSRGIPTVDVVIQNAGVRTNLIAMNPNGTVRLANKNEITLCLENSFFFDIFIPPARLNCYNFNLSLGEIPADIVIDKSEIINIQYVVEWGLEAIYELRLSEYVPPGKEEYISSAASSKLYNLLHEEFNMLYFNPSQECFSSNSLGSDKSLSSALASSSLKGKIRYRSSAKRIEIPSTLENVSHIQDIPVLDLFDWVSQGYINSFEKSAIERIYNTGTLSQTDYNTVRQMVERLGIKSFTSSIVMYNLGFQEVVTYLLTKATENEKNEFIRITCQIISLYMTDEPRAKVLNSYMDDKAAFLSSLKTLISQPLVDRRRVSSLLSSGILRAKIDNPQKFQQKSSENKWLECLLVSQQTVPILNQLYYLILNPEIIDSSFRAYSRIYQRYRVTIIQDGDPEFIEGFLPENNYPPVVLEEDGVDGFAVNDDIEEFMIKEREYQGGNYSFEITNIKYYYELLERFVTEEFSSLEFKFLVEPDYQQIFGRCNIEKIWDRENMLVWWSVSYPGMEYPDINKIKIPYSTIGQEFEYKRVLEPEDIYIEGLDNSDTAKILMQSLGLTKNDLKILLSPEYFEKLFKTDLTLEDIMSNIITKERIEDLKKTRDFNMKRKLKRDVFPGLLSILDEPELKSELECIFGRNYNLLLLGNVKITEGTFKAIRYDLLNMYKRCTTDHKATINILISCLKDTMMSEESDGWFVDCIYDIISRMRDKYTEEDEDFPGIEPRRREAQQRPKKYSIAELKKQGLI